MAKNKNSKIIKNNEASGAFYYSLSAPASAEITEKKSRFIANAYPVSGEAYVQDILNDIRKTHYDARHNCYAYIIGKKSEHKRFSDDKEPNGTAGKPILDVINGKGLTDTLVVVTRYFGGVLLGTGGLTRTYSSAAKAAIENSAIVKYELVHQIIVTLNYSLSGAVEKYIKENSIKSGKPIYEENVTYGLFVPAGCENTLINDLTNISGGNIDITKGSSEYLEL